MTIQQENKLRGLMGLCVRARQAVFGEDGCMKTIRAGNCGVLLLASGARSCIVVVPDNQLSLAIGKEGQNARLAAKLTGWKIDIKSQTQYLEQMGAAVVVEEAPALDQFGDFGGEAFTGIDLPVDEDDTL